MVPDVGDSNKPGVAAFVFDVTITSRGTFVLLLRLAFGPAEVRLAFLSPSGEAVKVVQGASGPYRFRGFLIGRLFPGESNRAPF